MLRKALLISAIAIWSMALAGCHLYIEDDGGDSYTNCDEWGCYPDGTGEPGWNCTTNNQCAAGCFCNPDGFCEEAGFCTYTSDCPEGYECDDRSSCVPEGSNAICEKDLDCPASSYCDEVTGECVGSWTCDSGSASANEVCGMGFECDDRNTCIPEPCTGDESCQEGCYCDEAIGECIETAVCDNLGNCPGDLVCDTNRNTCVPVDETGPTCQSELANCDVVAPICPAGSTAVIENGCYIGSCMAKADCPDGAPFECSDLNTDENACIANDTCGAVYKGLNCTTPQNDACTSGDTNCTCESFAYDYCEAP